MSTKPNSFVSNTSSPSPPLVIPRGHNSLTFHPPPIDGTLCVPEFFEYHAQHSPEHPLFIYADSSPRVADSHNGHTDTDGTDELRTIKYPEAWRLILKAARLVKGHYARFEGKYALQDRGREIYGMPQNVPPTIGILANAGRV